VIQSGRRARERTPAGPLLALALAAGCSGPPPLAPVSGVIVRPTDLAPSLEEAGIDGRMTVDAAKAALVAAGLAIDEGARRSYRASLEIVAFSVLMPSGGEPAKAEVVVALELEPAWSAGPIERRSGRGTAPFTGADRRGAWRRALEGAAMEAARGIALDLRAQQKATEVLTGDLSDADPRVRERALRTLAARGARGAARAAAACIHDPDPEVARAAVDALVAFRDPTTVKFLIEAAQAGGVATTIRLIPVLDEIGGPDVEGYLLTLQSGHGDRSVREAATDALARPHRAVSPGRGAKR
jgi:hypothetical protein